MNNCRYLRPIFPLSGHLLGLVQVDGRVYLELGDLTSIMGRLSRPDLFLPVAVDFYRRKFVPLAAVQKWEQKCLDAGDRESAKKLRSIVDFVATKCPRPKPTFESQLRTHRSTPKDPRCEQCGDPIRWATTPSGKRIPLEASPDPRGTYLVGPVRDAVTGQTDIIATPLKRAEIIDAKADGSLLWLAHAATCSAQKQVASKHTRKQALEKIRKRNV